MSRTILAVFESCYTANKAAHELTENGFPRELIEVAARDKNRQPDVSALELKAEKVKSEIAVDGQQAGAQIGAQIGGALGLVGGLLVGVGAMQIPGLPTLELSAPLSMLLPVLAGTVVSALAGGLTGGLMGQAIGLGVPEQEFRQYAKTVRAEPIEMTILADWDSVDPVIEILHHHNPLELHQKPVTRYRLGRVGPSGNNIREYGKREHHDRG